MSDERIAALARQVTHESVAAGDVVIREGELGDAFFLIADGALSVTVSAPDGAQIPLARLTAGDHFGEQALLEDEPAPRTATVRAVEHSRLCRVPGSLFREVITFDGALLELLKSRGRQYLLERLRKQSAAVQAVAGNLPDLGQYLESFEDRQVIFYQDDEPDFVHALVSGTVQIKFLDEERRAGSVVRVTPGQIFGELSAVRGTGRHGTAVAVGAVQVVAMPAREVWRLHRSSPEFRTLCSSLQNIYEVPTVGQVLQYQGTFMDLPAHCLLIRKGDGAEFVSYKLVDSDVFGIGRTHAEATQVLRHEAKNGDVREISLKDGELIGVTSYGCWRDSADMAALVMMQPAVADGDRDAFRANGTLPQASRRLDRADSGLLCRCMRVRTESIDALIDSGVTALGEIVARTGAGTVCGACSPRIGERLGHHVWTACAMAEPVRHTPDIWSFRFVPRNGSVVPFTPGQHLVVRADIGGNRVERAYTLTSTRADPYYEITVKREPQGLFSGWLFEQAGRESTVHACAPQGEFCVDAEAGRPIVFFCGGIGVTPAIAALRHVLLDAAGGPEIFLDHSVRSAGDAVFTALMNDAARTVHGFRFRQRTTGVEGRITDSAIGRLVEGYGNPLVYVCGPESFESSVLRALSALGVADADVRVERFTPVIAKAA